jgi:hypothetical protein
MYFLNPTTLGQVVGATYQDLKLKRFNERVRNWPISTRVNKPENDDPSIVEPVEPATDAA